jgi:probable rRNA maturation factor
MVDISNTTQSKFTLSKSKIEEIKNFILGKSYELSIAVVGDKKIQNLNKSFRKKDYVTDVLSFPLTDDAGEIFFNKKVASKKAIEFEMSSQKYFYYLMIHSMLHLKGFDHGKEMEKEEEKLMKKFNLSK